jgi:hypothetical protein
MKDLGLSYILHKGKMGCIDMCDINRLILKGVTFYQP